MNWIELNHLLQKHNPQLPLQEAFVELLRDGFLNHPSELIKQIDPAALDKLENAADVAMIVGVIRGSPEFQASSLAMSIVKWLFAK